VFCTAEGKPLSELSTPTEKVGGAPAPAESVFGQIWRGFGAVPLPGSQRSDRSTPTESFGGAPASDGATGKKKKKKKKTKKKKLVVMHGWSHTPLVRPVTC